MALFWHFFGTFFKKICVTIYNHILHSNSAFFFGGDYMQPANREKTGQFIKGKSGNPAGRPKDNPEVKEILKAACPQAAQELVKYIHDKNPKIALCAITEILNRVYGRPVQNANVQMDVAITPASILEAIKQRRNENNI